MEKDIFNDKKRLTRFISQLRYLPDTPALIQFIASDEDYLLLCSRIANDTMDGSQDLEAVKDICLNQEFDFQLLKERLTPVAKAFGLAEHHSSYYELLGIPRNANADRIKKAFRKRAVELHPDTGNQKSDSSQEFINLQAAYQILGDPLLRQQYDEKIQNVSQWKERADSNGPNSRNFQNINQNQTTRARIYYQLGGLFLLLIQEQKAIEAAVKSVSDYETAKDSSEFKSLPNTSINSRIFVKSDEIPQRENQKVNAEETDYVSNSYWP
jgi:hypothetical protein